MNAIGRRQHMQHPATAILLDAQMPRCRLAGGQHEVVVGGAADTQLCVFPMEILASRVGKFDAHV